MSLMHLYPYLPPFLLTPSELVIPVMAHVDDQPVCIGVLDMDSPYKHMFTKQDQMFFSSLLYLLMDYSDPHSVQDVAQSVVRINKLQYEVLEGDADPSCSKPVYIAV